jgi:hypothetical protein
MAAEVKEILEDFYSVNKRGLSLNKISVRLSFNPTSKPYDENISKAEEEGYIRIDNKKLVPTLKFARLAAFSTVLSLNPIVRDERHRYHFREYLPENIDHLVTDGIGVLETLVKRKVKVKDLLNDPWTISDVYLQLYLEYLKFFRKLYNV